MAVVESILIALGTDVAKYLAKEALPKDWQDQIAAELVSWGVRQVSARPEDDLVAATIGKRLKTLYDRSTLAENDKNAVMIEVIRTLGGARTDVYHLVEQDLDPNGLRREMLALRSEATKRFSADETALYEQMLWEASQGMVQVAGRLDGFETAQARAQLGNQRAMLEQQDAMLALLQSLTPSLVSWLEGPSQQAARFEQQVYRPAVVGKLNKLEPFGIDEPDRFSGTLRLTDTFIEPDLLLTVWERDSEKGPGIGGDRQGQRIVKQERRRPIAQALAGIQRLMVVGAAGSGKSTFVQWLAVRAAQQDFPPALADWNRLVPFFIRLRDYQGEGFPSPAHFADKITLMGKDEMPDGWAREVLQRGDGLVLIDGVDEMRRDDREGLLEALTELARLYPLSRFVVTSRPPAVDELAWPAWQNWLREADFAESWLADMHPPQIEAFVRRWHDALEKVTTGADDRRTVGQNRDGAIKLLQREPALRRLAATPLLCAMICALYQRQGDHIAPQRLELYRNCVDMLLWERDRRHPRRKVPALADYHEFKKDQLLRLLSHLAYWMMDEGASAVSRERVAAQFEMYLPHLGLDPALSEGAYEYFDERASMWDQPSAGMVEFRHRTFQEYLAAGWAMQQDKVGALAGRASNPTWRETIVLAAGLGTPTKTWALLRKILQRADKLRRPSDKWRYLLLLALDCLETCSELPKPEHWQEVVDQAKAVFPPLSREEAEMVANGGVRAIDLLAYDLDYPEEIAAYCIQALAAIGGDRAMGAIAAYAGDRRWKVRRAIGDAWSQFGTQRYAEQVLAGQHWMALTAALPIADRLRWLPNLTRLSLSGPSVGDLSALAGLAQLTWLKLSLSDMSVSNLGALAGLTQLTQLTFSLSDKSVRDLSALAGLTQLTHLILLLSHMSISDLSALAGLTQLTQLSLYLGSTPISDLSMLAGLTQLTQLALDLGGTPVSDLSALAGLTQLTELSLDLSGSSVSDLSALAGLTQLTQLTLYLSGSSVSDLSVLAGLTPLTELSLDLGGMAVSDLSALAGLTQLTQLSLSGMSISDLSALAGLTQLTRLSFDHSEASVSDLGALARLSQLTELSLQFSDSTASDLNALAGLTQLTQLYLDLGGTMVSDLSALAGLTQLTELSLRGMAVSDLSALAGLTQLTQLDLRDTSVSDLSALAGLPNLTTLVIDKKLAADAIVALGARRQRGVAIYTNYIGGDLYRYLPRSR
ncbi:MAG: NACHT domain-containing protein [Anaerolineae bacterium]